MKCEDAILLMNLVLDGEADPEQEQLLRFHINGCASCRRAMLMNRSFSEEITGFREPEPPEDLLQAVTRRIQTGNYDTSPLKTSGRSRTGWKIAAAVPFAAAAVLLLGGGGTDTRSGSLTDSPVAENTVDYEPAPVIAYSRPSSVTTF